MWSISRKKREPQRRPLSRSTKVQQPWSRRQTSRFTATGMDLPDDLADFSTEVGSSAPPVLRSGVELPVATRDFAAEVGSADPAPPVLRSEVESPAATRGFGAEVLSAAGCADPFVAEGDTAAAADFPGRSGFSVAATRSAVARPAVPDEHSPPAESGFRFRRRGRLGS